MTVKIDDMFRLRLLVVGAVAGGLPLFLLAGVSALSVRVWLLWVALEVGVVAALLFTASCGAVAYRSLTA